MCGSCLRHSSLRGVNFLCDWSFWAICFFSNSWKFWSFTEGERAQIFFQCKRRSTTKLDSERRCKKWVVKSKMDYGVPDWFVWAVWSYLLDLIYVWPNCLRRQLRQPLARPKYIGQKFSGKFLTTFRAKNDLFELTTASTDFRNLDENHAV